MLEQRIEVRSSGEGLKRCNPWEVLKILQDVNDHQERRKIVESSLGLSGNLSTRQSILIINLMIAYCQRAIDVYDEVEADAELMAMFPQYVPKWMHGGMDDLYKLALMSHGNRIYCRKRMDFQSDVSALFSKNGNQHRAALAEVAYANDERSLLRELEVLSRTK
jgi:hypothetical protein